MYDGWPKISRSSADIGQLNPDPYLSTDLEWNVATGVPTILGLSDGRTSISVPWNDGKAAFQERLDRTQPILLGHNFLSSDYQVLEKAGFKIRPEQVLDTIHLHWLTNMSLCKAKKAEDEEGERRGRGYMNLWTWCSLYTDAANWKDCIGESCVELGNPCPIHNPYDYNGCDAYWPVQAVGPTLSRARLMGVDRLLPLHRDLALVLAGMQERGLYVNRQYVSELRGWFKGEQARLRAGMTYNPDSPKQVVQYFKDKGIPLENAQQATIDALCDGDEYGADDELLILQEYGRLGNGPDRWFKDRTWDSTKGEWNGYVDAQGFIHCSLQFFTSSARLVCSNPNLQNVAHRPRKFETDPKNTLAMRIRRAIEAPEGMWLYEADYSNAENRVMLHLAGHPVGQDVDLHTWVAELAGFQASDPFCMQEGSPRQAAKTVQHGNNYGEGLQLLDPRVARSAKIRDEVERGLRLLYPDWTVFGQVVSFTGINFSRRAFGSASWENRKRANDILARYFGRFTGLRLLQQRVSTQVERESCVRNEFGYVLPSYGYEHDRIKIAWAFTGQNPVAQATKLAMLRFAGHPYIDCRLQVHDSLLFYVDRRWEPTVVCIEIRRIMEEPLCEMGGLVIPVEVKFGPNWADTKKIKIH